MENNEIINKMLYDLLLKTVDKKIVWSKVNENAIRWIKVDAGIPTSVTLQKQLSNLPNGISRTSFILTIQPGQQRAVPPRPTIVSTPPIPVQINSLIDKDTNDILAELFSEAQKESQRLANEMKIEAIKNLLNGL